MLFDYVHPGKAERVGFGFFIVSVGKGFCKYMAKFVTQSEKYTREGVV